MLTWMQVLKSDTLCLKLGIISNFKANRLLIVQLLMKPLISGGSYGAIKVWHLANIGI